MGTGRGRVVLAALALLAGLGLAGAAPVARGAVPEHGYDEYVPAGQGPFPLVVFLHGCTQDADDAAAGTRFHEAAAALGVAVIYPEQPSFEGDLTGEYEGNDGNCWNWFLEDHQHRGAGEPARIAGMVHRVMSQHSIDPRRVYVAGLSAGADMTAVMGATYPDLFAAVAVLSGCAYDTCTDVTGRAAYEEMQRAMDGAGGELGPMPAFIGQGSTDMVSNAALDHTSLRQWLGTNDWIDDGALNGSVPPVPDGVAFHGPGGVAPPSDTDGLCIGPNRFPCAGGAGIQGNYPYTVEYYVDAAGEPLVEHWLIHGLNHAYPNGSPEGTFTDPLGPDVTSAVLRFFLAHPKPATAVATSLAFTEATPAGGQFTDDVTVEARLVDETGAPVAGRPVTVGLAGRAVESATDGDGVARVTLTLDAAPGAHALSASFAGDDGLLPSEASTAFRVEREDTSLALAVDGRGVRRHLTARLADADAPERGVAGRSVTFMADGVVIGTADTDGDGVARLDVPPAQRGEARTYTAAFGGDPFFLASDTGGS